MTEWDRTASQIRRAEEARRRIRIRTDPVLPVIDPAPADNGAAARQERAVVFDIRDMSVYYGESQALGKWRSAEEIARWLRELPHAANSGDIYARLG